MLNHKQDLSMRLNFPQSLSAGALVQTPRGTRLLSEETDGVFLVGSFDETGLMKRCHFVRLIMLTSFLIVSPAMIHRKVDVYDVYNWYAAFSPMFAASILVALSFIDTAIIALRTPGELSARLGKFANLFMQFHGMASVLSMLVGIFVLLLSLKLEGDSDHSYMFTFFPLFVVAPACIPFLFRLSRYQFPIWGTVVAWMMMINLFLLPFVISAKFDNRTHAAWEVVILPLWAFDVLYLALAALSCSLVWKQLKTKFPVIPHRGHKIMAILIIMFLPVFSNIFIALRVSNSIVWPWTYLLIFYWATLFWWPISMANLVTDFRTPTAEPSAQSMNAL